MHLHFVRIISALATLIYLFSVSSAENTLAETTRVWSLSETTVSFASIQPGQSLDELLLVSKQGDLVFWDRNQHSVKFIWRSAELTSDRETDIELASVEQKFDAEKKSWSVNLKMAFSMPNSRLTTEESCKSISGWTAYGPKYDSTVCYLSVRHFEKSVLGAKFPVNLVVEVIPFTNARDSDFNEPVEATSKSSTIAVPSIDGQLVEIAFDAEGVALRAARDTNEFKSIALTGATSLKQTISSLPVNEKRLATEAFLNLVKSKSPFAPHTQSVVALDFAEETIASIDGASISMLLTLMRPSFFAQLSFPVEISKFDGHLISQLYVDKKGDFAELSDGRLWTSSSFFRSQLAFTRGADILTIKTVDEQSNKIELFPSDGKQSDERLVASVLPKSPSTITEGCISLSSNGKYLLAAGLTGVEVWDIQNNTKIDARQSFSLESSILGAALSDNGMVFGILRKDNNFNGEQVSIEVASSGSPPSMAHKFKFDDVTELAGYSGEGTPQSSLDFGFDKDGRFWIETSRVLENAGTGEDSFSSGFDAKIRMTATFDRVGFWPTHLDFAPIEVGVKRDWPELGNCLAKKVFEQARLEQVLQTDFTLNKEWNDENRYPIVAASSAVGHSPVASIIPFENGNEVFVVFSNNSVGTFSLAERRWLWGPNLFGVPILATAEYGGSVLSFEEDGTIRSWSSSSGKSIKLGSVGENERGLKIKEAIMSVDEKNAKLFGRYSDTDGGLFPAGGGAASLFKLDISKPFSSLTTKRVPVPNSRAYFQCASYAYAEFVDFRSNIPNADEQVGYGEQISQLISKGFAEPNALQEFVFDSRNPDCWAVVAKGKDEFRVAVGSIASGTTNVAYLQMGLTQLDFPQLKSNEAIVVGNTGEDTGQIKALDAKTLDYKWQMNSGNIEEIFLVDERKVLLHREDGALVYLNGSSGEELQSLYLYPDGSWILTAPNGSFITSANIQDKIVAQRGVQLLTARQLGAVYRGKEYFDRVVEGSNGTQAVALSSLKQIFDSGPPPRIHLWSSKNGKRDESRSIRVEDSKTDIEIEIEDMGGGIGTVSLSLNGNTLVRSCGVQDSLPDTVKAEISSSTTRECLPLPADRRINTFTLKNVQLFSGNNDFRLKAFSNAGIATLAEGATQVLVEAQGEKPNLHLIAIANNTYQQSEGFGQLNKAESDARWIANHFEELKTNLDKQSLYGDVASITTLLGSDAQYEIIKRKFELLNEVVKPQDTVVILVSGHGATDSGSEEYFYIPFGFERSDSSNPYKNAISGQQWRQMAAALKANHKVFVFDTCSSGALAGVVKAEQDDKVETSRIDDALQYFLENSGFHFIGAAQSGKLAQEGSGNLSVLTQAVKDSLFELSSSTETGEVSVRKLKTEVERRVIEISKKLSFVQTVSTSEQGIDFLISWKTMNSPLYDDGSGLKLTCFESDSSTAADVVGGRGYARYLQNNPYGCFRKFASQNLMLELGQSRPKQLSRLKAVFKKMGLSVGDTGAEWGERIETMQDALSFAKTGFISEKEMEMLMGN